MEEEGESKIQINSFQMGPWRLTSSESHILTSLGPKREFYEKELSDLPNLPEMLFDNNHITIDLVNPSDPASVVLGSLQFNALDALRRVDCNQTSLTVAAAQEWREAREDASEHLTVHRPFDWTYTTDYTGTLTGPWRAERTNERIDVEQLKKREKILFFSELTLFEDELGDNGSSQLSVKVRCMPSCFLLLQRFFLRVDHRLLRVIDTRIYWANGADHLLKEVCRRESSAETIASRIGGGDKWSAGAGLGGISPAQADQFCDIVDHWAETLRLDVPTS